MSDRSAVYDPPSVSAATCGNCGGPITQGATFCGRCGNQLAIPASPQVPDVPPVMPRLGLATGVIALVAAGAVAFPVGKWLIGHNHAAAAPSAPLRAAAPAASKGAVTCTNTQAKFTVKVPRTWTDAFDGGPCLRFNVPLGHDPYVATMQITPDAGPFDRLNVTGQVNSTKQGNVSGRPATVYETTYSDKGQETHAYGYLLQRGDEAFSIRLLNFPYMPVSAGVRKTFDEVVRELKITD